MTREEMKQTLNELLGMVQAEHQARASELLTTVSEGFETTLTESETNATRVQELTTNNETLRDVNAKLFLKIGTPPKDVPTPDNTPTVTGEGENELTFDKLFNDKGDLI